MDDYIRCYWVNFTTKPCLWPNFFALALFVRGYSFLLYYLGNSRCMTFADCRLQTADCRPQTADCRLQTADRRPQIADCKLKDKNLPNKGDTIKNITSCESGKVAWEQGWCFCAKLHWPHFQDAVGYSSPTRLFIDSPGISLIALILYSSLIIVNW